MTSPQLNPSPPTQASNGVSWPFVAYVAAFFSLIVAAAATREAVQPVTKTMADYLISWGLGVALFLVLYVARRGQKGLQPAARGQRFAIAVGIAYMVGFFGRSAFLVLNAALDPGTSRIYVAVIERVGCFRNVGTWWLVGAPSIPTKNNRMSIVGAQCASLEGDSVVLEMKPGLFRRPWLASYARHQRARRLTET